MRCAQFANDIAFGDDSQMSFQTSSPHEPSDATRAYQAAGVNLQMADALVDWAKDAAQSTRRPEVLSSVGGFSAAFKIPKGYQNPVILAACDGVGTKLALAEATGNFSSIGIDLVAMSVNDLLAQGGEPLTFLDYAASGKIESHWLKPLLHGVAEGCCQAGCALVGGETAEMPGFYPVGRFDVAGFCVGVVEEDALLPRRGAQQAGDVILGIPSNGPHSNGFSLIRKLLVDHQPSPQEPETAYMNWLMQPTQIYVAPVRQTLQAFSASIHAMAHITGGGLMGNIPRVLKADLSAQLNTQSWCRDSGWTWLQALGQLDNLTMAHTFNWGIGFVLIVAKEASGKVLDTLNSHLSAHHMKVASVIGHLIDTPGQSGVILT
ncbi:MAG: phosphoribosylformylglycinamidine cyclo-ligase [Vampirovibrionales bacterium]|nr:phosphoribosylformylglycinamidine cyclo-ligase [Vampirovibrionales bacterium]